MPDATDRSGEAGTAPETNAGDDNWVGLEATVEQAMEWGIDLCGQLATLHEERVVVGGIDPATIGRTAFGHPVLPAPLPDASAAPWEDIAALADAIRGLVREPPTPFLDALRPPYASAVALGQEIQDAQRTMGLPVGPIPFERAPITALGGFPPEVPPDAVQDSSPRPAGSPDAGSPDSGIEELRTEVHGGSDRRPDLSVLLTIAVLVGLVLAVLAISVR